MLESPCMCSVLNVSSLFIINKQFYTIPVSLIFYDETVTTKFFFVSKLNFQNCIKTTYDPLQKSIIQFTTQYPKMNNRSNRNKKQSTCDRILFFFLRTKINSTATTNYGQRVNGQRVYHLRSIRTRREKKKQKTNSRKNSLSLQSSKNVQPIANKIQIEKFLQCS